jgi:hypothetical protein
VEIVDSGTLAFPSNSHGDVDRLRRWSVPDPPASTPLFDEKAGGDRDITVGSPGVAVGGGNFVADGTL